MKKLFFIAIGVSFLMYSCGNEPFIYVEKNISHSKVLIYNINTTGSIDQRTYLYMDDLVKTLTDDLDGNLYKRGYTIKELTLQSASIILATNLGNTAASMNISSLVANHAQSVSPTNPLINYTNVPINTGTVWLANNYLAFTGVEEINKALAAAVKRLYKGAFLTIDIKGSPVPSSARVSAQLKLIIKFDMQYSYCEHSLFVIDGPVCQ